MQPAARRVTRHGGLSHRRGRGRARRDLHRCGDRDACRRGAGAARRSDRGRAPICSAPSTTRRTPPCCTTTASLMPQAQVGVGELELHRRRATDADRPLCVSYWMNCLQKLPTKRQLFVTLNPSRAPRPESVIRSFDYTHPLFDARRARRAGRAVAAAGARATPGSAAAISATASTRMHCSRGLPSPKRSARRRRGRPSRSRIASGAGVAAGRRMRSAHLCRHGACTSGCGRAAPARAIACSRLLLDLDELGARRPFRCSASTGRLLELSRSDHGDGATPLRDVGDGAAGAMPASPMTAGAIELLCYPRLFGFVFNPLTRLLLPQARRRARGHPLRGPQHPRRAAHLCDAGAAGERVVRHAAPRSSSSRRSCRWTASTASASRRRRTRVGISILEDDAEGLLLTASFTGRREELSNRALWRRSAAIR